jgi:hypothetical protein
MIPSTCFRTRKGILKNGSDDDRIGFTSALETGGT